MVGQSFGNISAIARVHVSPDHDTHRPATDLGYLLHKNHGAGAMRVELSFWYRALFFPQAHEVCLHGGVGARH